MDSTNKPQNRPTGTLGSVVVGLYAWVVTVSFGAVLLDVVYSNLAPEAASAFSEVADFLLLIEAVMVLAAFGAIGLTWNSRVVRNLLIASLVIVILGFIAPAFLSPFLHNGNSALGGVIRLIIGGLASILALVGLYKFYRNK